MRWVLGGFFALVGVVVLAAATATMLTAEDSRDWRSVRGTMLTSGVESRESSSPRQPGRAPASGTTFVPRVEYEYRVEGQAYHGRRFELLEEGLGSRAAVEARLEAYPAGAEVDVYDDPDDPASSVLKRGVPSAMGIPFFLGFVALAIGGAIVLFLRPAEKPYVRRSRPDQSPRIQPS